MNTDEFYIQNKQIIDSIQKVIDANDIHGELYNWKHEVFSLGENGMYEKKGLLSLPFVIEHTGDEVDMYTLFDQDFFVGDWFGLETAPFEIKSQVAPNQILTGIQGLVSAYFVERNEALQTNAQDQLTKESKGLLLSCFAQYK